jgi:hypothetical protein
MNKVLSILSVLLIVTFANATKKVSYSEILSSLAEVSPPAPSAAALMDSMNRAYAASLEKFNGFTNELKRQCNGLRDAFQKNSAAFAVSQKANNDFIGKLNKSNVLLISSIAIGEDFVKKTTKEVESIVVELEDDKKALEQRELTSIERQRVLKRLVNLVQDELTGGQRNSTVNTYNVDNNFSKFSFVEIHNQLKELQSDDAIVKSMITTLIMLTSERGIFANQKQVGKIITLIEDIIRKDALNLKEYMITAGAKRAKLRELKKGLNEQIETSSLKNRQNLHQISLNKDRIQHLQTTSNEEEKSFQRSQTRNNRNMQACAEAEKMARGQHGSIKASQERFSDLRSLLA